MSYAQALSGLDAASTQLDTIGNNIANSSTAGFKASTAEFADLFANSLSTSSSLNTGIGVTTAAIQQDFSQGDFATGTSLDVAINGNGFFRMNAGGVIEYSRDGQFTADKNGFIVNAEGATLTGFPVSASGVVSTTNPGPLQVPQGAMAAQASTQVTAEGLNLDSDLGVPTATPFDPTNSKSFTGTTQVTTIDSLGDTHTIQLFYVANPPSASTIAGGATTSYQVFAEEDGKLITPAAAGPTSPPGMIGTMTFNSNGQLTSFADAAGNPGGANGMTVSLDLGVPNGSTEPQAVAFNFAGATDFGDGGNGNEFDLQSDGFQSGTPVGQPSITKNGLIQQTFSNGQTQTFGQVVMANFNDPNGLQPTSNNAWLQTDASGQPIIGVPGQSTLGLLTTGEFEQSNVNLTSQLVDLITAQRFYQANAQTIKTQQTLDQTLLNL